MKISDEALGEFTKLYEEEFGIKLTKVETSEMAFRLITLYELLSQKLPNEQRLMLQDDRPQEPIGFRMR